jgi:hypothetical protein
MAIAYAASSAAKAAGTEAQDQVAENGPIKVADAKCCRRKNPAWFTFLTLFRVSMHLPVNPLIGFLCPALACRP